MAGELYSKPIVFTVVALVVILVGTIITAVGPLFMDHMHPKLDNLKPFSALELAGRDLYQREGCVNCHTQTVRPLKAEVMRYGDFSKAGEFAYDRPFLWGSKRTGPDLARIGGKYPDQWHYKHFDAPAELAPGSNMPVYGWMKENAVDVAGTQAHMQALGLPYTQADIDALKDKNEIDAMVAYLQSLGHAVSPAPAMVEAAVLDTPNPMAGNASAVKHGEEIYENYCASCHGEDGAGDIAPSLSDNIWLGTEGGVSDAVLHVIIDKGTKAGMKVGGLTAKGGMPEFGSSLSGDDIWALVTYIRSLDGASGGDSSSIGESLPGGSVSTGNTGDALFDRHCEKCHGEDGAGGFGPNLTDKTWNNKALARDDAAVSALIRKGSPKGMPGFATTLSDDEVAKLVSYMRSIAN